MYLHAHRGHLRVSQGADVCHAADLLHFRAALLRRCPRPYRRTVRRSGSCAADDLLRGHIHRIQPQHLPHAVRHLPPELHPAVRPQHRKGERLRRLRGGPHPDHRAHLVGDPTPVGASRLYLLHHCLLLRGRPLLRGGCPRTHLLLPRSAVVAKAEGNAALLHPDDAQQHHVVGVQQHESPHFGALFGDRGYRHLCRSKQVPPTYKYVVHRLHLLVADFRSRRVREARLPRVL